METWWQFINTHNDYQWTQHDLLPKHYQMNIDIYTSTLSITNIACNPKVEIPYTYTNLPTYPTCTYTYIWLNATHVKTSYHTCIVQRQHNANEYDTIEIYNPNGSTSFKVPIMEIVQPNLYLFTILVFNPYYPYGFKWFQDES